MNTRRYILVGSVTAVALMFSAIGFFVTNNIMSKERIRQETAASAPEYLYSVEPSTNKVLTYSVVPGDIKFGGDGFVVHTGRAFNVAKLPWDGCWYSFATACPKPVAAVMIISHPEGAVRQLISQKAGPIELLPKITWKDGQGGYQQQFFKQGEVVYVSDHPLATDDDDQLVEVPHDDVVELTGK